MAHARLTACDDFLRVVAVAVAPANLSTASTQATQGVSESEASHMLTLRRRHFNRIFRDLREQLAAEC